MTASNKLLNLNLDLFARTKRSSQQSTGDLMEYLKIDSEITDIGELTKTDGLLEPAIPSFYQSIVDSSIQLGQAIEGSSDDLAINFFSDKRSKYLGREVSTESEEGSNLIGLKGSPNDVYYNLQWGLQNSEYGSKASAAWDSGVTGSLANVIGVIDTGIDYKHPDLYLNIWLNPGEIPNGVIDIDNDGLITFNDLNDSLNSSFAWDLDLEGDYGYGYVDAGDLLGNNIWIDGIDNEKNGFTDDIIGWDFANNDFDPFDDNYHGTHVAGTIGALSNNQEGVSGVNHDIQLTALKFLDENGAGSTQAAINSINYFTDAARRYDSIATGNGNARYLATNNSWGGGGFNPSLEASIQSGAELGIIFVAAAGNESNNNDFIENYPSNYQAEYKNIDHVIAVASIDEDGNASSFTNYGPTNSVDIAAPGGVIASTSPNNGYVYSSGTSMAAPHVSGALGLLASKNPQATSTEIIQALYAGADRDNNLLDTSVEGKRLNIANSVDFIATSIAPTLTVAADAISQNEGDQNSTPFTFTVTREGDLTIDSSVQWTLINGTTDTNDFVDSSNFAGTLNFINGSSSQTISIDVAGDSLFENDEDFSIQLLSAVNATFKNSSASATIINDDQEPDPIAPSEKIIFSENFESADSWNSHWVQDSQNDWSRRENARTFDGSFAAELDGRANNAVLQLRNSLDVSSFDDAQVDMQWLIETSFDNNEFLAIDVSTNEGSTWKQIDILTGANGTGGDEQSGNPFQNSVLTLSDFGIDLSNSSTLDLRFRGSASRSNEDAYLDTLVVTGLNQISGGPTPAPVPPTLTVAADAISQNEGDQNSTPFTFTVTREGDLTIDSAVQWTLINGTTDTNDFVDSSNFAGTLNFINGSSSQTISIDVAGDSLFENDEDFSIQLLSAVNATFKNSSASATIINDDQEPDPIAPSEKIIFSENFESADSWNSHWVQDSQNDWRRRENARTFDGSFAAELDGRANNAVLQLRNSLDVSSFDDAQVDMQWLIETSFDNNEFLAIDVSTNEGLTWQQIDILTGANGTGGDEQSGNPFQNSSLTLSDFGIDLSTTSTLILRFRGSASRSNEDAYLDTLVVRGLNGGDASSFSPPDEISTLNSIIDVASLTDPLS